MECLRDQFDDGVVLNGRYQTIAPLNHGSFGMVFMARDLETTDTVAIKCLTKKSAAPEAGLDFAIDDKSEELILHSRLGTHPNIVNLLDSFETEAHIYIVLEFCPRGDLYEAIRHDHGPLETEHVRRFMLELVDSVAYIHSKGVFHRDIKPENIFLTQSSSMKLGDFGLATTDKWSYETTVGSDRYMSPEQYDSAGAGYSPAQADIWAIGICLLNILFSRNPFTMPTEADPLFLDFSRDKQSLFDVFPSMSQDTYEVIVECMNLDPSKRSLVGARNALRRVVSFTTMDEALDDFSSADRRGLPASNREPLRTPSIQSPQVDTGAFPWAKALQTSPHHALRQLSVIPDDDDESYTEELFPKSEGTTDWCSATTAHTPSMASVLNSSLTNSMQSLAINRPQFQRSAVRVSPMAGSLPINMTRPRNQQAAMSLVFGGHKDTVSKSWSDMWEEDIEEEEEHQRQLQALKELNSRTWSQDSKVNDENTPRQGLSPSAKAVAINIDSHLADITNQATAKPIDEEDILADGFFFHDVPVKPVESPQRYSPPPKRSGTDKWAVLGDRRRGATNTSSARSTPIKPSSASVMLRTPRHVNGHDFASLGHGVWDHHPQQISPQPHFTTSHTTTSPAPIKWTPGKERAKECPWNKGREWNWRRDRRDIGDVEWVGGWQDAHS